VENVCVCMCMYVCTHIEGRTAIETAWSWETSARGEWVCMCMYVYTTLERRTAIKMAWSWEDVCKWRMCVGGCVHTYRRKDGDYDGIVLGRCLLVENVCRWMCAHI
jgi:hypothetical protein